MYGKLFKQMYEGSLVAAGWEAVITLQQLVILADKHGIVDMTPEALARLTTIPLSHITAGLAALEQADPQSRTPDEDGRRIVRLSDTRPWGWRIVNYDHYRNLASEEDRRDYQAQYWRDKRSPKAKSQQDSTPTQQGSTDSRQVEAVGRGRSKVKRTKPAALPTATEQPSPFPKSVCDTLYEIWTKRRGAVQYSAFRKALLPLYPAAGAQFSQAQLTNAIEAYSEYVEGLEPREAGFESVHRFAADVQRWVRLGAMPAQENGGFTERGILAMGSAL